MKRPVIIDGSQEKRNNANRPISWFSCGAASYMTTKLALKEHGDDLLVCYLDPGWEHEDNARFLRDVEKFLGIEVQVMKGHKFKNPREVFEKRRYLGGIGGAPCTSELKRTVRQRFESGLEIQYFGFHNGEERRARRLIENNGEQGHLFRFPLIEQEYSKIACLKELERDGIEPPITYRMGFKNANCLGCIKGGKGYFKKIRKHFRDRFEEIADLVFKIGYTLFKDKEKVDDEGKPVGIGLRDIDWGKVRDEDGLDWECNVLCSLDQLSLFKK